MVVMPIKTTQLASHSEIFINALSYVRMAILPMGTGTRGYYTRMGRVWEYFCTHG
jgi:hypothetical protein